MKVKYTVNNYQLGGKVRTTPTDRIISEIRIDKSHVEIVYDLASMKQKAFCDKVLAKKGEIIEC